ncbi:enoyl-ACP reductase FabV [Anaerostipes sp. MSJ-23]|uniref:enoyl-ACP reductase FabV n=1 Tax=Anaerostipes sp. MSJ-23 TaxID=2841520 RepID=UPI001C109DFD|nr:enoyl-ACP reductase FabV [Anaerostipes sp. MSJ-23]MBU5458831.1 trans-2-enoyl-CoA reductase family protein [Anaerostipes sp. MSJ-23]
MIIAPKVKDFLCLTAHPEGCKKNVSNQIAYVRSKGEIPGQAKKVLVIGCSTGYGLASRIVAAFGCHADTIGIMFEKPAKGKRTATPGWYNTAAFEKFAKEENLYAKTINGDAFSQEVKDQTIEMIRKDFGKVDLVIYSLAAPRRTAPDEVTYRSVLKTTGEEFTNKNLNLKDNTVGTKTIPAATKEEIHDTVKVMGGEDWKLWMEALSKADVLEENTVTVAYSYIGSELTYPIYFEGTIGAAKKDLHKTAQEITEEMKEKGVHAYISVNKGLVTQASAAIPIVPLYMAILYKVMKEKKVHEGCIEQIDRLFLQKQLLDQPEVDEHGWIRLDDLELSKDVQTEVKRRWELVDTDNIKELGDIEGYWEDFYHMFGFGEEGVDYEADVDPVVSISSMEG